MRSVKGRPRIRTRSARSSRAQAAAKSAGGAASGAAEVLLNLELDGAAAGAQRAHGAFAGPGVEERVLGGAPNAARDHLQRQPLVGPAVDQLDVERREHQPRAAVGEKAVLHQLVQ